MSDRAQRVLDTLIDFNDTSGYGYPFKSLHDFVMDIDSFKISQDYELLTADEEKQVIKAFLEFEY